MSADYFAKYQKEIAKAVDDPNVNLAMGRAVKSYSKAMANVLHHHPSSEALAKRVREIKERSIPQMEALYAQAKIKIEEQKGKAYLARTKEDLWKLLGDIIGTQKVIVKTKSVLGEEVGIRDYLISTGNEVWETDLGELIFQLQSKHTGQLSPSMDITREQVAVLFEEFFGKPVPADIPAQTALVREFLRDKFYNADVGISSANVVAADTGSLIIIECEGNVRLATGFPPIHIAIVGLEKLVPSFDEAMKVAEATWRHAGFTMPSYLNVISCPSKTADIEKVLVHGVHGPSELHVIFVDNGRLELAGSSQFRDALFCLRCDGCLLECPVFRAVGSRFGRKYLGGIGTLWTAYTDGGMETAMPMLYTCLRCGRCMERCPVSINVPLMIGELRKEFMNSNK
jgi:iron-sulfur cluster protein